MIVFHIPAVEALTAPPAPYDHKPGDRYFILERGGTSLYQNRGDQWRFVDPHGQEARWLPCVDDIGGPDDWSDYKQVTTDFVRRFCAVWSIQFNGLGTSLRQNLADRVAAALAAGETKALDRILRDHILCTQCQKAVRHTGRNVCDNPRCVLLDDQDRDQYHREEAINDAQAQEAEERSAKFDFDANGCD